MAQEHPTRIPAPTSGTNRIHRSIFVFTTPKLVPCSPPPRSPSPTRSDLEDAYRVCSEEEAPASDQLLSLKEILAGPAPTPLERAMVRPLSGDFNQVVNIYDREGGWSQRRLKKGGLSNLRVAHDAKEFLSGELGAGEQSKMLEEEDEDDDDDGEIWSKVQEGREKEGYEGAAATLLASFEEVAAMQGREEAKGMKARLREKLGWKKGKVEISWPVGDGAVGAGALAAVEEGLEEVKSMAEQARMEGRDARVEQIALRVHDLANSLRE